MGNTSSARPREENSRYASWKLYIIIISSLAVLCVAVAVVVSLFVRRGAVAQSDSNVYEDFPLVPFEDGLNLNSHPCDDFYSFVCDHWASHVQHFEEGSTPTTFLKKQVLADAAEVFLNQKLTEDLPNMVKGAIKFYESCKTSLRESVDYAEPLIEILHEIGGWPLMGDHFWDGRKYSWVNASVEIYRSLDIGSLFNMKVIVDESRKKHNILMISPISVDDVPSFSRSNLLKNTLTKLHSKLDEAHVERDIIDMASLLAKIKDVIVEAMRTYDSEIMPLSRLRQEVTELDWVNWLPKIMEDPFDSTTVDRKIDPEDRFYVKQVNVLDDLLEFLQGDKIRNRPIANLVGWMVVATIQKDFIQKLESNVNPFDPATMPSTLAPQCFQQLLEIYYPALNYLYVMNLQHKEDEECQSMVDYSKSSLKSVIDSSSVLTAEFKEKFLARIKNLKSVMWYPDYFTSKEKFDEVYGNFPEIKDDNVVRNYITARKYFTAMRLHSLYTVNDANSWRYGKNLFNTGMEYFDGFNIFIVPAHFRYPPFFYPNGSRYLNYGSLISYSMGELINQGFNLNDEKSKNGRIKDILACHTSQYKAFSDFPDSGNVVAVEEDLGHAVGMEVGLEAYKLWRQDHYQEPRYPGLENFTSAQMFFVSYASPHCSIRSRPNYESQDPTSVPGCLKVNGPLLNSKDFSRAFGCKEGDKMNPLKKCAII